MNANDVLFVVYSESNFLFFSLVQHKCNTVLPFRGKQKALQFLHAPPIPVANVFRMEFVGTKWQFSLYLWVSIEGIYLISFEHMVGWLVGMMFVNITLECCVIASELVIDHCWALSTLLNANNNMSWMFIEVLFIESIFHYYYYWYWLTKPISPFKTSRNIFVRINKKCEFHQTHNVLS